MEQIRTTRREIETAYPNADRITYTRFMCSGDFIEAFDLEENGVITHWREFGWLDRWFHHTRDEWEAALTAPAPSRSHATGRAGLA